MKKNVIKIKEVSKAKETESNLKLVDIPLCNYIKTYEIDAHKYKDTSILFDYKKSNIIDKINKDIKEYNGVKFSLSLSLQFFKDEKDGKINYFRGQRHEEQSPVLDGNNVNEFYNE